MRVLMAAIGVIMLAGGVLLVLSGVPGAFVGAIWLIPSGIVLTIVALVEVGRYRSQSAESGNAAPGPGGGETSPLEPRFKRTDEVFVDPTTRLRMRVYIDANTGERRYIAEG